jgi:beta-lactamase
LVVALASLLSLGASQALAQTTQEVEQQLQQAAPSAEQAAQQAAQITQQGAQQVGQAVQQAAGTAEQRAAQLSAIVQRAAAPVSAQQASTALSSSGMDGLLQDLLKLPDLHWGSRYIDVLRPSTRISNGGVEASALPSASVDLNSVTFTGSDGKEVSLEQWQKNTATDGLVVLHRGQLVYERYDHGQTQQARHILWSATKSVAGLLALDMIQAGQIDPSAPIAHYLPELKGSAWEDATVQQTLDMSTAVDYAEEPLANPGVVQYMFAGNILPSDQSYPGARTVVDFLKSLKKKGEHGQRFTYKSVDTEVIGLLLEKVTGKDFATLVSERLWKPMGAQQDATVLKDRTGVALKGSGMSSSLRDLARVGELVRLEGRFNGKQLLQPGTVAELKKGGDPAVFKAGRGNARDGSSYHDFWWIAQSQDGTLEARGLAGQHIYVDQANELVVAKFSADAKLNPTPGIDQNAFAAIANAVKGR